MKKGYINIFKFLQSYLKQEIMKHCQGLTNTSLMLFQDAHLQYFSLVSSHVTMQGLEKFLNFEEEPNEENIYAAEYWEELDELRTLNQNQPLALPFIHEIDISYSYNIPGYLFAATISKIYPFLSKLDMSGCFYASQGPIAINLIAKNLKFLKTWIMMNCGWLSCNLLLDIDWHHQLTRLIYLNVTNSCDASALRNSLLFIRSDIVVSF